MLNFNQNERGDLNSILDKIYENSPEWNFIYDKTRIEINQNKITVK